MSVSILVADDESDVAELFRQRFRREVRSGTYVTLARNVVSFGKAGELTMLTKPKSIQPRALDLLDVKI